MHAGHCCNGWFASPLSVKVVVAGMVRATFPIKSRRYKENSQQVITDVVIFCAGVIVLLFLKLMFDMSRSMNEMIGYACTISQDVCGTQASGIPVHNNPA